MPDADALPIFPLDNVVLFPKVQVPLFIFEPRYCQMTAAALSGERRIGMAVVLPPHGSEMSGDPDLFPIGCEGEIRHSQPHEDGTYHIILAGVARFRIREEIPRTGDRLYRLANVERLHDGDAAGAVIGATRTEVLELMARLAPEQADRFRAELFAKIDDETFVNALCQSIDFPTLEKQQLLEANSVRERCNLLLASMRFQIAERSTQSRSDSRTVH